MWVRDKDCHNFGKKGLKNSSSSLSMGHGLTIREFPQKFSVRVRNLLIDLEFGFKGCG